jgi:hypothetical protein
MWSEEQLDNEFALMPGGERGECELDLSVELDVEEMLTEEGRVMDDVREGEVVEGIWRILKVRSEDEEMVLVPVWEVVRHAVLKRRVGHGEVMDVRCVYVVRELWKAIRVDG